jgi:hypothetical protein
MRVKVAGAGIELEMQGTIGAVEAADSDTVESIGKGVGSIKVARDAM